MHRAIYRGRRPDRGGAAGAGAYAQSLRAAGRLIAGGPFADDSGAIPVYEAGSADEILDLIAGDPQQRGMFVGTEVKQWNVIADGDVRARLVSRRPIEGKR